MSKSFATKTRHLKRLLKLERSALQNTTSAIGKTLAKERVVAALKLIGAHRLSAWV